MRDALSGKSRVNYDDLSEIELRELYQLALRVLQVRCRAAQSSTWCTVHIVYTYLSPASLGTLMLVHLDDKCLQIV